MKDEIDYSKVPPNFPRCIRSECPKAGSCLRQLAMQNVSGETEYLKIINPKILKGLEDDCPYYREASGERYARGFKKMLEEMPYNQTKMVTKRLIEFFGIRKFYHFRNGVRPIPYAEQQDILRILEENGVPQPQEFDAYTDELFWR